MSATHRTVQTPNPALRSLVVSVGEASFQTSGGDLPPEGTLYSDPLWRTFFGKDYKNNFDSFRYVCQLEDTAKGGQLLFVKSLTPTQRNTAFRTITYDEPHGWPTVLTSFNLVVVENAGRSYNAVDSVGNAYTNTGPSYYVQTGFKAGGMYGTKFTVEEYFSDVPYSIGGHPAPITSNIQYDLPGTHGTIPECLHGGVTIPALVLVTASRKYDGAAFSFGPAPADVTIPAQTFAATNFTNWASYVVSDKQTFNNGYHRVKVTVDAPTV